MAALLAIGLSGEGEGDGDDVTPNPVSTGTDRLVLDVREVAWGLVCLVSKWWI